MKHNNRINLKCRLSRGLMVLLCCCLIGGIAFAESAEQTLSPTTGLPTDKPYRPYLVVVSNAKEARPSWGFADADIVYETIYWGPTHTRYLALYNDVLPDTVGSLRGARVFGAELALGWDAVFVHQGGQDQPGTSIYDFFDAQGMLPSYRSDGTRNGKSMRRLPERVSPHNGVANLEEWDEHYWPVDEKTGKAYEPRLPVLKFSDNPTTGTESVRSIDITYDQETYRASYAYDDKQELYIRSYCDVAQTDMDGRLITCANVIVQSNELDYYNGNQSRPVLATTGTGLMTAFIRGTSTRGYWERAEVDDPIQYYDEAGNEIVFAPGKTFVQVVTPKMYEQVHQQVQYVFSR